MRTVPGFGYIYLSLTRGLGYESNTTKEKLEACSDIIEGSEFAIIWKASGEVQTIIDKGNFTARRSGISFLLGNTNAAKTLWGNEIVSKLARDNFGSVI